jgi:hypothetical protein
MSAPTKKRIAEVERLAEYASGFYSDEALIRIEQDYEVELKRLRKIGKTIKPATAETTFWWADDYDPYDILPEVFHIGSSGRVRFARDPGGEWVEFGQLPAQTAKALWKRDGRKLSFPYGLNPDDDVINHPPAAA